MSESTFSESVVEQASLAWLEALGYSVLHGRDIAVGGVVAERGDPNYCDVVLDGRLRSALVRLNPDLPAEAVDDAYRKLMRLDAPSLIERNRAVHRMLVEGVPVEFRRKDGSIAGAQARVIDFDDPDNNDWLAINQFTGAEGQHLRRPDIVLFMNGLPLAVIELKNAADEDADVWGAFRQLQTYQAQIPALFSTNVALVASDGTQARIGSLGAGREWFKPWRTIGGQDQPSKLAELQVMLEGVFEKRRFLDLIRYSSCSRRSMAANWSRRWPATISSMPSTWRWRKRCERQFPRIVGTNRRAFQTKPAVTMLARWPAARKATVASVSSGTPRARERA